MGIEHIFYISAAVVIGYLLGHKLALLIIEKRCLKDALSYLETEIQLEDNSGQNTE